MITVSDQYNNPDPSLITFFGIYSNGLVIQLEYEFKIIIGNRLSPQIMETVPIRSS